MAYQADHRLAQAGSAPAVGRPPRVRCEHRVPCAAATGLPSTGAPLRLDTDVAGWVVRVMMWCFTYVIICPGIGLLEGAHKA